MSITVFGKFARSVHSSTLAHRLGRHVAVKGGYGQCRVQARSSCRIFGVDLYKRETKAMVKTSSHQFFQQSRFDRETFGIPLTGIHDRIHHAYPVLFCKSIDGYPHFSPNGHSETCQILSTFSIIPSSIFFFFSTAAAALDTGRVHGKFCPT